MLELKPSVKSGTATMFLDAINVKSMGTKANNVKMIQHVGTALEAIKLGTVLSRLILALAVSTASVLTSLLSSMQQIPSTVRFWLSNKIK